MALTKCPECGHKISNKAIACPNCGAQIKRGGCLRFIGMTFLIVFLLGIIVSIFEEDTKKEQEKQNVKTVKTIEEDSRKDRQRQAKSEKNGRDNKTWDKLSFVEEIFILRGSKKKVDKDRYRAIFKIKGLVIPIEADCKQEQLIIKDLGPVGRYEPRGYQDLIVYYELCQKHISPEYQEPQKNTINYKKKDKNRQKGLEDKKDIKNYIKVFKKHIDELISLGEYMLSKEPHSIEGFIDPIYLDLYMELKQKASSGKIKAEKIYVDPELPENLKSLCINLRNEWKKFFVIKEKQYDYIIQSIKTNKLSEKNVYLEKAIVFQKSSIVTLYNIKSITIDFSQLSK